MQIEMSERTLQARENLKKIFKENPDIYQAFRETMQDMMKPENVERMAQEIGKGIEALKAIQMKAGKASNNVTKGSQKL